MTKNGLQKEEDEGAHSPLDQVIACPILRTSTTTACQSHTRISSWRSDSFSAPVAYTSGGSDCAGCHRQANGGSHTQRQSDNRTDPQ